MSLVSFKKEPKVKTLSEVFLSYHVYELDSFQWSNDTFSHTTRKPSNNKGSPVVLIMSIHLDHIITNAQKYINNIYYSLIAFLVSVYRTLYSLDF